MQYFQVYTLDGNEQMIGNFKQEQGDKNFVSIYRNSEHLQMQNRKQVLDMDTPVMQAANSL